MRQLDTIRERMWEIEPRKKENITYDKMKDNLKKKREEKERMRNNQGESARNGN